MANIKYPFNSSKQGGPAGMIKLGSPNKQAMPKGAVSPQKIDRDGMKLGGKSKEGHPKMGPTNLSNGTFHLKKK